MRKRSKKLFACFSLLTMLVGFFLPNFTYIVKATDDVTEETTFSHIDDGILSLNMTDNRRVEITGVSNVKSIDSCHIDVQGQVATANLSDGKCVVETNFYGRAVLTINYYDSNDYFQSVYYTVDVELETYANHLLNKLPDMYEHKNNVDFYSYLNSLVPNNVSIYFDGSTPSGMECYNNVSNNCVVNLSMMYSYYDEVESSIKYDSYILQKNIVKVDYEQDSFVSVRNQAVAVGEHVNLKELSVNGSSRDYFWVSEDNTIARIDEYNKLVGVAPGKTKIRLVNKKTMEYYTINVKVDNMFASRTLDDVLNVFRDTVNIDISNNIGLYGAGDDSWNAASYFNALASNITGNIDYIYTNSSSCADGLNDCIVEYKYWAGGIENPGQTQLFDIKYRGIRFNSIEGFYYHTGEYYYVYNGNNIKVSDITNLETVTVVDPDNEGQTISQPAEILIDYDEEYLQLVNEDTFEFKTLKEGYTKIDLYTTTGYMTSVPIYVLFSEEELSEVQTNINAIQKISVPYNVGVAGDYIQNYVISYFKTVLEENRVSEYLDYDVVSLPNDDVIVRIDLIHNGRQLRTFVYDKLIDLEYSSVNGDELINSLELYKNSIQDRYVLSFKDTIELVTSSSINNQFFIDLYKSSELVEDIKSDMFTTKIVYKDKIDLNNRLIGGAYYDIYIYKDDILIDVYSTIVMTNFVVEKAITATVTDHVNYIRDYIKNETNITVNVTHAYDEYYLINYEDVSFYILYDYKEKIEASTVNGYWLNPEIIALKSGEEYQFNYSFYPFTANYYDFDFTSSDESVFTVDEDGKITAVGQGRALLSYDDEYFVNTTLVIVDISLEEYLDSIIDLIDISDVKLPYSNYVEDIGLSLEWAIDSLLRETVADDGILDFIPEYSIEAEDGRFNVSICVEDVCSSKRDGRYRFVGIYSKTNEFRLSVGDEIQTDIKFTEGDLSNVILVVNDESVARIDRRGKLTGLKPGFTYISAFDKFHEYLNDFYVYVDYDKYVDGFVDSLSDVTVNVDGSYFDHHSELSYSAISGITQKLYDMGYSFGDIGWFGYSSDYDPDRKVAIYSFNNDDNTVLEIKANFVGIHLSTNLVHLGLNKNYTDNYYTYTDGTVTATSSNTDICSVNGTVITGESTGICHVTYKLGDYEDTQTIVVDREGMVEQLNQKLVELPNQIDIKLDAFDNSKKTDFNYVAYYDAFIYKYFLEFYPEDSEYGLGFNSVTASDNGDEIDVSISYLDYVYGKYSYRTEIAYSEKKTIKLNYIGHSEGWEELGKSIVSNLKEEYILTPDQMMEFTFMSGDVSELHNYSDFNDDLERVCSDCEYIPYGRGGVDAGSGVINEGFQYYLFKNGEPIAFGDSMFYGYLFLDLYEIKDDRHVEDEVRKKFREAYKKHRHEELMFSPFVKLKTDITTSTDEEELEVDLVLTSREGNLYNYDVTIEGNEYKTSVYLNILTDDLVYDIAITDISLNKQSLDLEVGESDTLVATLNPTNTNEKLVWSSSDDSVATVDNGKVTANGSGSAIITVQSASGNVVKEVDVTVVETISPEVKVEQIILNKEILNMTVADTFDLIATVIPNNATNKQLKWSSTNTNVVTVENGKVTAIGSGDAVITVESLDGNAKVTINVSVIALVLPGDIDADGKINIVDLIHLRKHLAGITVLTGDYYKRADFNKDGLVNIVDLVNMRKHLAA